MDAFEYRGVHVRIDVHPCTQPGLDGLLVADIWYSTPDPTVQGFNWVTLDYAKRPAFVDRDLVLRNAIRDSQAFIDRMKDEAPRDG